MRQVRDKMMDNILLLTDKYNEIEKEYNNYTSTVTLRNIHKNIPFTQKPFRIVFCGIFSSGKSSLVNALLGGDYLPTGINPITKAVTRIRYGPVLKYYCLRGGIRKEISKDSMERIVSGKEEFPKKFKEILVEIPSDILKNNVEIVDTPGYQDNDFLEEISRRAVIHADMAVMCFNGVFFGNMFEREYIEELNRSVGNFCIVVNRMDNINTEEEIEIVKESAQNFVYNKGNACFPEVKQGKCFFTVSCGKYKNINDIEEYIHSVLSDTELMKRMRITSNEKYISFLHETFTEKFNFEYEQVKQEYELLKEKYDTENKNIQNRYNSQKHEIERKKEFAVTKTETISNSILDNLREKFEQLKESGLEAGFEAGADRAVNEKINELINLISIYSMQNGLGSESLVRTKIKPVFFDTYKVPKPELLEVRTANRKNFFTGVFSTIVNIVMPNSDIKDLSNYNLVYNDYVSKAVHSVRYSIISKIKMLYKDYLEEFSDKKIKSIPGEVNIYEKEFHKMTEILSNFEKISKLIRKE